MKALPLDPPRARPEEPEHPFHGSLVYQGIAIDVENRAGSTRSGVDPDGERWSVRLPWHYGEIRGTKAYDGDAVDVFVGPDRYAPYAYCVQQKRPGTQAFDEPKLMLGFARRTDALAAFRAAYTKPGFILGITRWPMPALIAALASPEIQRGRFGVTALQEAMRKGRRPRSFLAILRKAAEQLGLFGAVQPAGPKKRVHVKAHVRHTAAGATVVAPHDQMRTSAAQSSADSIPWYAPEQEVPVEDQPAPPPPAPPPPAPPPPALKEPAAKLPKDAKWEAGRITLYGTRHTVTVRAGAHGLVDFVYEITRGGYRFAGVQRSAGMEDGRPVVERLTTPTPIPRATWMRVYKDDKARRGHYA